MKPYTIRNKTGVAAIINLDHVTMAQLWGESKVRFWLQGQSSPVDETFETTLEAQEFLRDFPMRFV